MYKILITMFIKDNSNIHNSQVRKRYGIFCSIIGIISNLLLSIAKIVMGVISGSISIMADGIDNLTDCSSSIATLIGFNLANSPADSKHPYGHERIEYLCGIIVSILVLIVGVMLGKSSIEKIISRETIDISMFYLLISILVGSIIIKLWQFGLYRFVGKKINSLTIIATSQDSLNDCIKTSVVLLSVVLFRFFAWNVDAWFGLGVSIYIIINGIILIKTTSSPLIGESPTKEYTKEISDKILSYDGVLGLHDLMIHNYGPEKSFITVHVEVDSDIDILISHDIIDNIERDFNEQLGALLTIHMDPIQINDELTNTLKDIVGNAILEISPQIRFHDFRIVKGVTHINILFDIVVPLEFDLDDQKLLEDVSTITKFKTEEVVKNNVNVIINIDKDFV